VGAPVSQAVILRRDTDVAPQLLYSRQVLRLGYNVLFGRKRATLDEMAGIKARRNGIYWIISAACDTPYRLLCSLFPPVVLGAKRRIYIIHHT